MLTLMESKTTLKDQVQRISDLEGEGEILQKHQLSLEEKVQELESKLRTAISAKGSLNLRVGEQLEGCIHTCTCVDILYLRVAEQLEGCIRMYMHMC